MKLFDITIDMNVQAESQEAAEATMTRVINECYNVDRYHAVHYDEMTFEEAEKMGIKLHETK